MLLLKLEIDISTTNATMHLRFAWGQQATRNEMESKNYLRKKRWRYTDIVASFQIKATEYFIIQIKP